MSEVVLFEGRYSTVLAVSCCDDAYSHGAVAAVPWHSDREIASPVYPHRSIVGAPFSPYHPHLGSQYPWQCVDCAHRHRNPSSQNPIVNLVVCR